ncbi:GAF domain-containing protein [Ureibacillus xyleni]|uniref:GAF domain-containing protein n=1 Tax=Ureibacillus xyleni TaxID=614648 RepID=A0A285SKD8_9BACL|nr:LuxR C-terminal-related transcriptional regulator [Ureibacillus xyleni]SOC08408.1 GAF domain-containing protein [Ureibacillus xyleni]
MNNGDYEKVINFMDEMTQPIIDFRSHVLKTFEKLFGFHQSNFWLIDDHSNLVNPIRLNIDQSTMNDYLEGCFQWDYHMPKQIFHKLPKQRVLRIEDIIPVERYEHEAYYNEFMRRHGFYHQMVAYIINGGKLLGGVCFVKPKSDKPFSLNDVKSLEIITRYLSECMITFEEKQQDQITCISEKEREVIELVQRGFSNKEIAQTLFISIHTVKKHLQNIYQKLNVPNRTSLCYKLQGSKNNLILQ